MFHWALSKREAGLILIAGHTHRPVFQALSLVDRLNRELVALERRPDTPERQEELKALEAQLEWVRTSEFQTSPAIHMEAPSYFNTGCCSFSDGDVTGLEIADGTIQLMRWPNNLDQPLPAVLQEPVDLRRCFEEVRTPLRPEAPPVPERGPAPRPSPEEEAHGWNEPSPSGPGAPH